MTDQKNVQLIQITPAELSAMILVGVQNEIQKLREEFQPKEPEEYLSRQDVAQLLQVDISTVHNYSVKGILKRYKIGQRVLYKRSEIEKKIADSVNGFFED